MLNASVAGVTHRDEELQREAFAAGEPLALVADPDNRYDPDAVEVWDTDRTAMVGYVPREVNERVAAALRDGQELHALVSWEWRTEGRRVGIRTLISPEAPNFPE